MQCWGLRRSEGLVKTWEWPQQLVEYDKRHLSVVADRLEHQLPQDYPGEGGRRKGTISPECVLA